jgi:hypothetical protein
MRRQFRQLGKMQMWMWLEREPSGGLAVVEEPEPE